MYQFFLNRQIDNRCAANTFGTERALLAIQQTDEYCLNCLPSLLFKHLQSLSLFLNRFLPLPSLPLKYLSFFYFFPSKIFLYLCLCFLIISFLLIFLFMFLSISYLFRLLIVYVSFQSFWYYCMSSNTPKLHSLLLFPNSSSVSFSKVSLIIFLFRTIYFPLLQTLLATKSISRKSFFLFPFYNPFIDMQRFISVLISLIPYASSFKSIGTISAFARKVMEILTIKKL